jgi:hypothetical protein
MNLPFTPELGALDVIEIYSYYDGPRLMSCKGHGGQTMLAVWLGGERGEESWYVAPLTKTEFRNLRFGELELRAAFENPETGHLWFLRERPKKSAEARRIELRNVRRDWLPDPGETLELGKPVYDSEGNVIALRPPDLIEISAVEAILRFFELNPEVVVTTRQLEVAHEDQFFHWVTNRAIHDLLNSGELLTEERELDFGGRAKLIWPRGYRYPKRGAKKVIDLVQRYSTNIVGRELGHHGEMLVFEGFVRKGFSFKGREVKQNGGNTRANSNHDLDFVFERDGIGYGIEVKNTLGYMDHGELRIKIDLAHRLGVRPVIVARMLPRTWIQELNRAEGFGFVMKYQLYPPALSPMANEISREMGLPVGSPRFLEDRTMNRFETWHKAQNRAVL